MEELVSLIILAQTIYGEAEGENFLTKLSIGQVIKNRVLRNWRGSKTYEEVCKAHLQFSCWNDNSPRLVAMLHPRGKAWDDSLKAALAVITGAYEEPRLFEIYHYTDTSIGRPVWAEKMELVKISGIPKINFWR